MTRRSHSHCVLRGVHTENTGTFFSNLHGISYSLSESRRTGARMGCKALFILLMFATSTLAVEVRKPQKTKNASMGEDEEISRDKHILIVFALLSCTHNVE